MSKEKTVELKNLTIGYLHKKKRKIVIDHINANIRNRELTCLLGANGIGKSTLLRTLSAFLPKLDGEIYIKQNEISTYSEKQLSTLISVVFTSKCDVKNMSAYELIGLGRSPYTGFWGSLSKEDKLVVDKAISLVKIENLSHRMVDSLSDGERQKVMIAKALTQDTPIIFLDEPTAFLDFPSKVDIMQLLHRLTRETDKTIFMSTHDLELALQIADKIWLIDKQSGVTIGTPEDLSIDGKLSSFFASKGILFDQELGLFRIENTYSKKIRLSGNGLLYTMTQKALLRNGILANRDIESDDYIEIDNESKNILLVQHAKSITIESIEQLLEIYTQL